MNRLPEGTDPRSIPVGVLAYIGDAVYELHVRMKMADSFRIPSGAVHARTIERVCAAAQARSARAIRERLTEEEEHLFLRARNHAVTSSPRNVNPAVYRMATGFEAVVGFLYLTGQDDRLQELLDPALKAADPKEEDPS